MSEENIKIATSIPSLKDKIHVKVEQGSDSIYWYIRFNIPLDEKSVSDKTMNVTDTDGYIMNTDIAYDEEKHMIVISPLDSYEQDRFYLLNISKKVCSARGQRLKRKIHILFKLKGNRISDFKTLKSNVVVPKPRPRPKDYDLLNIRSRVYTFDSEGLKNLPKDTLPLASTKVNIWLGLCGVAIAVTGAILSSLPVMGTGLLICILGIGHIVFQLTRLKMRSAIAYNSGARLFNQERYVEADRMFRLAHALDPANDMAEYALGKTSFYL